MAMDAIDTATFNYSVSQGDTATAQSVLNKYSALGQSSPSNGSTSGFNASSLGGSALSNGGINLPQAASSLIGSQISQLTGGAGGLSGLFGGASPGSSNDARVRLGALKQDYYTGILQPLAPTNGVLFPYTPQISFSQEVDYTQVGMVHTDMDYYAYQRTPSVTLTVQGKFTVQNTQQGVYALAAIHFFRSASKMYFGQQTKDMSGLPPPILVFSGYGPYMFNKLNCILKSHSFSYNEQIDTVPVNVGGGITRLPAMFDINCTITVQQTPTKMRTEFNLDEFRSGQLMAKGGWI